MGDRFNIGFRESADSPTIWLYSHSGGSDRYSTVASALQAAKPRWTDPSYATRIVISNVIGKYWDTTTGHGISVGDEPCTRGDYGDVPIIIWDEKVVWIVEQGDASTPILSLSFQTVLDVLDDPGAARLWGDGLFAKA